MLQIEDWVGHGGEGRKIRKKIAYSELRKIRERKTELSFHTSTTLAIGSYFIEVIGVTLVSMII